MRRVAAFWVVGALVVTVSFALGPDAVSASSETLTPEDVGVGSCNPDPVVVTHVMDCRFPLSRSVAIGGAVQAVVEGIDPRFAGEGRSWPCRVVGRELICERLDAVSVGTLSIGVDVDGSVTARRAAVTVRPFELPAEILIDGNDPGIPQIPIVVAGDSVRLDVRRRSGEGRIWLSVRLWPDRSEVLSLALLNDSDREAVAELTLDEPGRYELVSCAGPDPRTCDADPSGPQLQIIRPVLEELIDGHNLRAADRINLVVTGGGWESTERLAQVAAILLDPSAEPILSADRNALWWPPFAIEPLRSNGYRFNLWLLPDQIDPLGVFEGFDREPDLVRSIDLKSVSFLHLQADPIRVGGEAKNAPQWPPMSGPDPSEDVMLGSVVMFVNPSSPFETAQGISHELGHSVFGLNDEYPRDSLFPNVAPPNCAETRAEAEQWWGDLIGELDPQFIIYRAAMRERGLWTDELDATAEDDFTVGYIDGWCTFEFPHAVVPSKRSLMMDEAPVFGAVNRRQVESVLQRWTGTARLATEHVPDALTAECSEAQDTTTCELVVAPLLAAPHESIEVRLGGAVAECVFLQPRDDGTGLATCPTIDRESDVLEVSVDGGPWTAVAVLPATEVTETTEPAPPATTALEAEGPPDPTPTDDDSNSPLWIVMIALLAGAASLGVYRALRRRKS